MISKLFRKKALVVAPIDPSVPEGTIIWAVGDVHGRLDLLKPLIESMVADLRASTADRKVVVFLGDYVDRGPDSRGVVRLLSNIYQITDIEWRFLKGNHEQAMLEFLDDPSQGARWCEYGGDAALKSYHLRVPELSHRAEAWARVAADLNHKLTDREKGFLYDLELSLTIGDYFFSHAGARPGVSLDRQIPADLMWIRSTFLDSSQGFEKIIVHGHTPTMDVHADCRRIGVDTKAYESGILSALRLEGRDRATLHAMGAQGAYGRHKQAPEKLRTDVTVTARPLKPILNPNR